LFEKTEKAALKEQEPSRIHWQLPTATSYIQRPKLESAIVKAMNAESTPGEDALTVLVGMPGAGKTLAAETVMKDYLPSHHVFWFNAKSKKILLEQYRELLKERAFPDFYGLPNDKVIASDNIVVNLVKNYICSLSNATLIIFDGVDNWSALQALVPFGEKNTVLVTASKRLSYLQSSCIKVEGMQLAEAIELVQAMPLPFVENEEDITTLVNDLQCFPGLILQAIKYIQTHLMGIKDYLSVLQKNPIKILDDSVVEPLVALLRDIDPPIKQQALNLLEIIARSDKHILHTDLLEKAKKEKGISGDECFIAITPLVDLSLVFYESFYEKEGFVKSRHIAYAIVKTLMRSAEILQRIGYKPLTREEPSMAVAAAASLPFFTTEATTSVTTENSLDPEEQKANGY
jgi:hypothetical protein